MTQRPNGAWHSGLDALAERAEEINRISAGYVQWRQKQARLQESLPEARKRERFLIWLRKILGR